MDKILKLLSENSNLTYKEIATMLGEPEDYIEKQIKQYEKDGVIKGYQAVIDATAYIELTVTPEKDTGFDSIAQEIMNFDEVESVYLMAGSYDLLVLVKGASVTDIAMFVAKKLSTIDAVVATSTRFKLKTYKESGIEFDSDNEEDDKRSIIL